MGNVASLFQDDLDKRYACFDSLTTDDVAALWEKEKRVKREQRRHRYKCGSKYVLASSFKPWDIQVNAAIYETLPTIEQQLREEQIALRRYELQAAHKQKAIVALRATLARMCEPGEEFEPYANRLGEMPDKRIGAVLAISHYNLDRAARYLLVEMREGDDMKDWRKALREHIAKLPPTDVPTIGFPKKENQVNALIHHDFRTIPQALEVYDKLNGVVAGVWRQTEGRRTLGYNEAYALLRDSSWKVAAAVTFFINADRAYAACRGKIVHKYHRDSVEDFDPTALRTYLRRANFDHTMADEMYAAELKRRAKSVADFKQDLKDMGTPASRVPSDRALMHHLMRCFWDPGFAKDYYEFPLLAKWDEDYQARVKARRERQAKRDEARKLKAAAPAAPAALPASASTSGDTKGDAGKGGKGGKGKRTSADDLDVRRGARSAGRRGEAVPATEGMDRANVTAAAGSVSGDDTSSESGETAAAATAAVWADGRLYDVVERRDSPAASSTLGNTTAATAGETTNTTTTVTANKESKTKDLKEIKEEEEEEDELEEITLHEAFCSDTSFAAQDTGASSADKLMRDEEARDELQRKLWEDSRDRDVPLVPEDMPCEANTEINKLVSWYHGDITTLEVDAIINPVSEKHILDNATNKQIAAAAGEHMAQELTAVSRKWHVGECKITLGYNLPARYVIHVCVPNTFNQELMERCVKGALDLAKSHGLGTVAMPPFSIAAKKYPRFNAVHVETLTTRRWLDVIGNRRKMDKIVFVTNNDEDKAAIRRIMPFYFPGPNLNTDSLFQRYKAYRALYQPAVETAAFKRELAAVKYEDAPLEEDGGRGGGRTSDWRPAPLIDMSSKRHHPPAETSTGTGAGAGAGAGTGDKKEKETAKKTARA